MTPLDQLVFVGFNSRVLALDRESGEIIWTWQASKPRNGGYVTMLLDDDRLVVSPAEAGTPTPQWSEPPLCTSAFRG